MRLFLLSSVLLLGVSSVAAQRQYSHLPNSRLTPGESFAVTQVELCKGDYVSPASKIPVELKSQVFDRYGIGPMADGLNVDHLIPVSLGGSNSLKNLWPQPLSGEWNYHRKNRLEARLHKLVCRGVISLETAREQLARDWISAYKKHVLEPR